MIVERHGAGCFGLDGKERKVSRGLGFFGRTHTHSNQNTNLVPGTSNTKGWCGASAVRCGAVRSCLPQTTPGKRLIFLILVYATVWYYLTW